MSGMADLKTIARPYARAAFEIAARDQCLEEWLRGLRCAAAIMGSEAARRYLARPAASDQENVAFIHKLCEGVDEAAVLRSARGENFLRLLAANDRLPALPEIAQRFEQLKTRAENKVNVRLVAAAEVDTALTGRIRDSLQQRLGRGVAIETIVDSGLIGGAVVQADDMVIDGSIRSRLQRLAEKLMA
jgi:F-type H+-transporting ATPase subunit delta